MSVKRWLRRAGKTGLWLRWRMAAATSPEPGGDKRGLARCAIRYINLDRRADRRAHIEAEFDRLGASGVARFAAIANDNGALGCALSHGRLLQEAWRDGDPLVMVCEDDCAFLADRAGLDALIEEFAKDDRLDVLCLAFNASQRLVISGNLAITTDALTTACYVAKQRVLPRLIAIAETSARMLENGMPREIAAIDVVWQALQRQVFFAIPVERAARQIESHSDIEGRIVDYRM